MKITALVCPACDFGTQGVIGDQTRDFVDDPNNYMIIFWYQHGGSLIREPTGICRLMIFGGVLPGNKD
jgi:hypothetical protein